MTDFDNLFLKYHQPLFRYALKFIEDQDNALDLVQEVFIAVWERGQYRTPDAELKAYLFAAVKNSCLNYIKHQIVVRKFEHHAALQLKELEATYYLSGKNSLIEKETIQKIEDAIDSLTDIYKEVIVLSRFEGLKNKEIATHLNIPLRTVETRIFRAIMLLKDKISAQALFLFFLKKSGG